MIIMITLEKSFFEPTFGHFQQYHIILRDHGMNGAHAMPFVAQELDHVIANVFAALLVVQVVTRTCPKRKNAKVMTI